MRKLNLESGRAKTKAVTFFCDNGCGVVPCGLLNGYWFGDTLLEGVYFEVRSEAGKLTILPAPDAKEYFATLNQKLWLKAAREFLASTDFLTCPKCKGDFDNPWYKETA